VKPISLANAGQECPAYRDRRDILVPMDGHMPDISPGIAAQTIFLLTEKYLVATISLK